MDYKICLVFTETVEREPSHLGVSGSWWDGRKLFGRVGHVRIFVGRVQIVPWGSGGPSQWDSTSGVRLRVPCRPNHEGRRWKVSQSSIKRLNTFMAGFFCALFRKLRSQINSKNFLKTQHFGGMTKIFCYFSWVLLKKAWKKLNFPPEN